MNLPPLTAPDIFFQVALFWNIQGELPIGHLLKAKLGKSSEHLHAALAALSVEEYSALKLAMVEMARRGSIIGPYSATELCAYIDRHRLPSEH